MMFISARQTATKPLFSVRHLVLGLSLLIMAGCGFQLRGLVDVPEELKTLYVSAPSQTSTLRTVRNLLRSNGVTLVDSAAAAPYHLQILNEKSERRSASRSSSATAEEYELRSSLNFQIKQGDTLLVPPTEIFNERSYRFDENNVNAKDAEEAMLRSEMQSDLANQLVRRYLAIGHQIQSSQPTPQNPQTLQTP